MVAILVADLLRLTVISFLSRLYRGFGAVNCTNCTAGTYTNETGQVMCNECDPGIYDKLLRIIMGVCMIEV